MTYIYNVTEWENPSVRVWYCAKWQSMHAMTNTNVFILTTKSEILLINLACMSNIKVNVGKIELA